MLLKYIRIISSEPKLSLQELTVSNMSFYITTNNESMLIRSFFFVVMHRSGLTFSEKSLRHRKFLLMVDETNRRVRKE
jgi:hypothetical protein